MVATKVSSSLDSDASMLHRQSGQPFARTTQALYKVDDEKKEEKNQNNWIEDQIAISEGSSDEDEDKFKYNVHLVPVRQQKTCARVVKFYWFWFVVLLGHYFIFFGLPSTVGYCTSNPQMNRDTGDLLSYGEEGYKCNTFQ